MQFNIWEILYDYFGVILAIAFLMIIISIVMFNFMLRNRIKTKVLIIRDTTGMIVSVKEKIGDSQVKINKRWYKRRGEPLFISGFLSTYRLFIHKEGTEFVVGVGHFFKKLTATETEKQMFQELIESKIIEQSVRGLFGALIDKIIMIFAGMAIGVFAWEILRSISGG